MLGRTAGSSCPFAGAILRPPGVEVFAVQVSPSASPALVISPSDTRSISIPGPTPRGYSVNLHQDPQRVLPSGQTSTTCCRHWLDYRRAQPRLACFDSTGSCIYAHPTGNYELSSDGLLFLKMASRAPHRLGTLVIHFFRPCGMHWLIKSRTGHHKRRTFLQQERATSIKRSAEPPGPCALQLFGPARSRLRCSRTTTTMK